MKPLTVHSAPSRHNASGVTGFDYLKRQIRDYPWYLSILQHVYILALQHSSGLSRRDVFNGALEPAGMTGLRHFVFPKVFTGY